MIFPQRFEDSTPERPPYTPRRPRRAIHEATTMKMRSERKSDKEYHSAANDSFQRQRDSEPAASFVDRRPGTVAQQKLQEAISNGPSLRQLRSGGQLAQGLQSQPAQSSSAVAQRAPHRPDQGAQIRYQGNIWTVQVSHINNPQITIRRAPNHVLHLNWAAADYTILRQNNAQDHDLRENDLGALNGPVDAYAGLSSFERRAKIRQKFSDARAQALQMIKASALPQVNQASVASLNAITLGDFHATRTGPNLTDVGKKEEAAEWELTWIEGAHNNPRRTWTFVIDADNPLPTSSQDPHVGWTVSAEAGSQAAVGNTFGHVWLDHVPVMRE
jgi:hypothetical protein